MPGGQRHDRRLQPWPERAGADLLRHPGAGPCVAVPAAQLVRALLGPGHADRRQLSDLVAAEPPARRALLLAEPMPASTARVRVVIDDLIDLMLGTQLTTGTPMSELPTGLTTLPLPHQLLRLCARLRTPLRPRLRRIHRRRLGTRTRVLTRLLLKPPQPILVLRKPPREIETELHTRLTPCVKDRLRVGAVHACTIRCTNTESLPEAPTTERLPGSVDLQGIYQLSDRRPEVPSEEPHPPPPQAVPGRSGDSLDEDRACGCATAPRGRPGSSQHALANPGRGS